jgi:hypothetical protein
VGESYSIDRQNRIVHSRGWGVLTTDDLRDHYCRMMADPGFSPDYRQLADLRRVTALTVNGDAIKEAAGLLVFDAGTRRAIVASADVAYGLSRMFAAYAEHSAEQHVRVFRDLGAAQQWLESDDTSS